MGCLELQALRKAFSRLDLFCDNPYLRYFIQSMQDKHGGADLSSSEKNTFRELMRLLSRADA